MNKKIKIIEIFEKYVNNEELPKKIAYKKQVFNLYSDSLYATDEECLDRFMDYINYDFSNINDYVEILEDNTEEIEELEQLNAYKLMEAPYMTDLLKEQRYDEFMEHLKQSEVEIADKLMKLIWAVDELRKEKE